MLNSLQGLLAHLARHLGGQNETRLGTAGDRTVGGVRGQLVGGSALVRSGVLGVAVEDVEDDDAEVVEGPESVTGGQGLAVLEPLNLETMS